MKTLLATTAAACALSLASLASAQSAEAYADQAPAPTSAERALSRSNYLMISGAAIFGAMYTLNTAIAIDHLAGGDPVQQQIGALELIPGIGPYLAITALPSADCSSGFGIVGGIACGISTLDRAVTTAGLVVDGTVQLAGLTLLLVGAATHGPAQHAVNAERRTSFRVTPGAPGAPAGLSLSVVHF
jgi:hypothetical protein